MGDRTERTDYSIASVSKLTGVSCHALRVWERRYGFPVPNRSPAGHRRYGADQVRILRRVEERLRAGEPIGSAIARLRAGEFDLAKAPGDLPGPAPPSAASALLEALAAGDITAAETEFRARAERLFTTALIYELIEPALVETGERWFRQEWEIHQEHFISGFLRRKLNDLYNLAQRDNARPQRKALIGTVQGDRHEGGVLILCTLLELAGWRAIYLGVDLPVREYQRAVARWSPDALGLSFVLSRNINKRFKELAQIAGAPVFVGGRSILNYQGLARRHGLLPLVGRAHVVVSQMIALSQQWAADRHET